ncbi:MAG: bifunctional diguanylate cyclase/phosphodiesterase [Gemmatimonadota bacterium]
MNEAVRLAAIIAQAPMAAVVLADQGESFFAVATGFTPWDDAFGAEAGQAPFEIPAEEEFVILDLPDEERFQFFAGVPVLDEAGRPFGLLCVLDRKPRQLSPASLDGLSLIASGLARGLARDLAEHPADRPPRKSESPRDIAAAAADPMWSHQSGMDQLTRLPNRVLAFDRLSVMLSAARRTGGIAAAMFIGLDRFCGITSGLSGEERRQILQLVGHRLSSTLRDSDTVARFSGDEFLVVCSDMRSSDDIEIVANKLLEALRFEESELPCDCPLSASIGISVHPTDGHDPHAILRNANAAMYRAMEEGGDRHAYFSPELSVQAQRRSAIETRLHQALAGNEFHLEYLPLLDVETQEVVGAEALLRWRSPDLGQVAPRRFVPVAEEAGLITNIGRWVLETAGLEERVWEGEGDLRLCVNVSASQITDPEFLESVQKVIDAGLAPERLELEMTESALIPNGPEMPLAIAALDELGVRLSLDDFGTGYSALSHMQGLPLDSVKLDSMLLRGVASSPEDAALAAGVIDVAHRLGLTVVGEGVETAEQWEFLRRHGCDEAQGYYLGEPMSAEKFHEFRKQRNEQAKS